MGVFNFCWGNKKNMNLILFVRPPSAPEAPRKKCAGFVCAFVFVVQTVGLGKGRQVLEVFWHAPQPHRETMFVCVGFLRGNGETHATIYLNEVEKLEIILYL